jgi:tetratricopeptide (TPR) repeat protein/LysM repeat protein
MEEYDRQALAQLRRTLTDYFNEDELRTLCFDLGVDYESLSGEGKASKTRELIVHLERHNRIGELLKLVAELRPNVYWGIPAASEASPQQLTRILIDHFDEQELRTLCFDLGVDYHVLPGKRRKDKARELVEFSERRDRIPDLIWAIRRMRPDVDWGISAPSEPSPRQLWRLLSVYFNESELRTLCSDLRVDYDDLPGEGIEDKARELIAYFDHRARIPELIEVCRRLRPNVEWREYPPTQLLPTLEPLPAPPVLYRKSQFGNCLLLAVIGLLGVAALITAALGSSLARFPAAMLFPTLTLTPTIIASPSATQVITLTLPIDTPTPIPATPTPGPPSPPTATPTRKPTSTGAMSMLPTPILKTPPSPAPILTYTPTAISTRTPIGTPTSQPVSALTPTVRPAATLTAAPPSPTAGPTKIQYTVRPGDTLLGIALLHHVSMASIQLANDLGESDLLRAGQTLAIPTRPQWEGELPYWIVHTVQRGETVSDIAQAFGLTASDILRVNAMADPGQIHVGQPIVIPLDSLQVAAVPPTSTPKPMPVPTVAAMPTPIAPIKYWLAFGSQAMVLGLGILLFVVFSLGIILVFLRPKERQASNRFSKILSESSSIEQAQDRASVEMALDSLKRLSQTGGDYEDAMTLFEKGWASARKAGEKVESAAALNYVASSYRTLGRSDQAIEYYQTSLAIWRKSGDRTGESNTLNNIGSVYRDLGRTADAQRCFEESLSLIRALGNRVDEANILLNLGRLLRIKGDLPAALDQFTQSEKIWRELGDKSGLFLALNDIGTSLLSAGDVQGARQNFEQVLVLSQELGNVTDQAVTLTSLGLIALQLSDWENAKKFYGEASQLYEKLGDLPGLVVTLTSLATVYTNLRQWDTALEYYRRAQAISRRIDNRAGEAAVFINIGNIFIEKGEWDNAIGAYQQAQAIQQAIGDQAGSASTQDSLRVIYRRRDEALGPLSLLVADAKRFFQAAGFTLDTTGEISSFICQPAASHWLNMFKCAVHTSFVTGQPLDANGVLKIHQTVNGLQGKMAYAFVLVDQAVTDEGWLQIATFRATSPKFNVIPIPLTMLDEGKVTGKAITERMLLDKHLRRFLGSGYDPYDVRDPVSDVLNFFGREALAHEIIEHLKTGQPTGMFGLRKMGKSSLMRYMQRLMPCPTAWLDLQAGIELAALYERILRAWNNDAQARFKLDLGLQSVKLDADPAAQFFQLIQSALDQLAAQAPEARLAIFLDEVELVTPPVNAEGPVLERYLSLMRMMRGLVQEDGRVSLMVAGVDATVNRINRWGGEQNPFYQLLREEYLPPLLEADCIQMTRNIGRQVELAYADDAANLVAQASGGHPFLARQLCSLAYKQRGQQPGETSGESIQKAIERFLFDPQYTTFLSDTGLWGEISNVKLWGDQAAQANQAILLALARSSEPLPQSVMTDGPDSDSLRAALFALQQLWVIRPADDSLDQSDPRYKIAFDLFHAWIRHARLGLKE